jgi:hypothetical protein
MWVGECAGACVCVRDPFAGQAEEGDEEEDGDVSYAACQEPHVPRQSIRVVRICALSTRHSMAAARVGLCVHTSHPGRSMRDVWLCVSVCVCVWGTGACVCTLARKQSGRSAASERKRELVYHERESVCV